MKKILSLLASMVAIAVLFTACSKSTEKNLTKKDGKWNIVFDYEELVNGEVVFSISDIGTMTFKDDKFTITYSSGDTESGTFTATDDKIILTTDGIVVSFDIIESKKNSQIWENVVSETVNGETYEEKITLKLTR